MRELNIVVCVKPVSDPRFWDKISFDAKTGVLRREGIPVIIGPLDNNALEEALRIREKRGGRVAVISMGPPNTVEILKWALVLGADDAVLLTDKAFAGADTLATAYTLAMGIKKLGKSDLILFGNMSLDGSTGHIAPQVAEFLGIPHVTGVNKIDWIDENVLRVKSEVESGHMTIETQIPVALAVEKDLNELRLPSMFGAIWANEKAVKKWSADDIGANKNKIGLAGSGTLVCDMRVAEVERKAEVLNGAPAEVAKELIKKLRADGVFPKV